MTTGHVSLSIFILHFSQVTPINTYRHWQRATALGAKQQSQQSRPTWMGNAASVIPPSVLPSSCFSAAHLPSSLPPSLPILQRSRGLRMLNWGIFFFFNPASHFFFLLSTPSSHSRCLTFEGGEGGVGGRNWSRRERKVVCRLWRSYQV